MFRRDREAVTRGRRHVRNERLRDCVGLLLMKHVGTPLACQTNGRETDRACSTQGKDIHKAGLDLKNKA
jgi:hypothetical protein